MISTQHAEGVYAMGSGILADAVRKFIQTVKTKQDGRGC